MTRDPNHIPPINTRGFTMTTKLHGEVEVEVRGTAVFPEYVVQIGDEWIDADEVFDGDEWDEAIGRAGEPADTCHHGN